MIFVTVEIPAHKVRRRVVTDLKHAFAAFKIGFRLLDDHKLKQVFPGHVLGEIGLCARNP